MKKTLVFLAFVSVLTGCSVVEQPGPFQKGEECPWSIKAVYGGETKTSLSGTTLSWVSGDKIGAFADGYQTNRPMTTDGTSAFSGNLIITGTTNPSVNYYAYYPYTYSVSPSTTVSATLSDSQVAPFDGSANFMVADVIENKKYDEEDMPDLAFEFNNQLMSIVKITVTNTNDDLAAQQIVGATLIATSGQTLAGQFTFDVTNPMADPIFSGDVTNTVNCTFPEASRPTLGTGESHSMYLIVNPTIVTSLKVLVKTTDHVFAVTSSTSTSFTKGDVVSLPTIDIKNYKPQPRVRQCVLWGDSITNNDYLTLLRSQLGSDWEVVRGGVPGDRPLGIAGRQGSIPLCLNDAFTIPASNSASVEVGVPYSTKTTSNTAGYTSLGKGILQYYEGANSLINPCTIKFNDGKKDVEIEGRVTDNGNGWNFTRTTSGEEVNVPAKATLITYAAQAYKDADVIVVYMGANGGYSNYEALRDFYQQMVDYTTSKKAVVVGFHMGYMESSTKTFWTTEYRDIFRAAFGDKYLDLKTEGTTRAEELLHATGRLSPGQVMNAEDAAAVAAGYWPESLSSPTVYTNVHFNYYGSKAMAILVKEKMKQLGYLDY